MNPPRLKLSSSASLPPPVYKPHKTPWLPKPPQPPEPLLYNTPDHDIEDDDVEDDDIELPPESPSKVFLVLDIIIICVSVGLCLYILHYK